MPSGFDVYVRRNTWMYALDPRVKLGFVLESALVTFLWPRVEGAAGVALACVALLALAQVPARRTLRFVRGTAPFLLVVFALTSVFGGRQELLWWGWGPLQIGPASVYRAALLAARLLALGLVFFAWLSTTDQAAMVRGFVALGLPYEYGLTLALALRYLPLLAGLFQQVREAQEARGLDLVEGGLGRRLAAYRPVLVAVVIGALRQAEHLGWALESRALGTRGARRTIYCPLAFRPADYGAMLLLLVLLTGVVVLRLL